MLVTFRSEAYPSITMFGDVAVTLIKLMGHSGAVPSQIEPASSEASKWRTEPQRGRYETVLLGLFEQPSLPFTDTPGCHPRSGP
jgi:hypothetical protein